MTTRYIDRPSQFLIENLEILFLYIGEPRMLPEMFHSVKMLYMYMCIVKFFLYVWICPSNHENVSIFSGEKINGP